MLTNARITFEVAARSDTGFVPVETFMSAVANLLEILKDVDISVSGKRKATLNWQISEISLHSPLLMTMVAESDDDGIDIACEVVRASIHGLRQINENVRAGIPPHFAAATLENAKKLVSVLNDGIAKVAVIAPDMKPVMLTQHIAAHVDELIAPSYEEVGTVEGMLETISVHGKLSGNLYDVLTEERITCIFTSDEQMQRAHGAFRGRVAVSGVIRYAGSGKPISIRVEEVLGFPEQLKLPKFKDLEGIDLTGELSPMEYVRSLRDED